jgi:hypothetical protein
MGGFGSSWTQFFPWFLDGKFQQDSVPDPTPLGTFKTLQKNTTVNFLLTAGKNLKNLSFLSEIIAF